LCDPKPGDNVKQMKIDPVGAGLDERRLERITDHIQTRYIDPGRIAGCQVAVARHGHTGYFRSFGTRDRERSAPVEEDTIWRIYSMTKPITGVALMSLYERAMFQLSDPVTRFIPEWRDLKVRECAEDGSERLVAPRSTMTVRDLLMHMSGLGFAGGRTLQELLSADSAKPGQGLAPGARRGPNATLATMVERYAGYPLEFHPGTHWFYSVSTDVCGRLVEIISGQRFDEYLKTTVFDPLAMHDTGFMVPDAKVDRFAACYRRDASKRLVLVDDPQRSTYREEPSFLSGGGGLVSTTADYLRFCQMLLNGGELDGVRILSPATVQLMGTNVIPKDVLVKSNGTTGEGFNEAVGFGLDFMVVKDPRAAGSLEGKNTMSWGGAAGTWFWIDPTNDIVFVGMIQRMGGPGEDLGGEARTLTYQALTRPEK